MILITKSVSQFCIKCPDNILKGVNLEFLLKALSATAKENYN